MNNLPIVQISCNYFVAPITLLIEANAKTIDKLITKIPLLNCTFQSSSSSQVIRERVLGNRFWTIFEFQVDHSNIGNNLISSYKIRC